MRSAFHLPDGAPCRTYLSSRTRLSGPKHADGHLNPRRQSARAWPRQGVKPKVPEANMGKAETRIDVPARLPLSPPLYSCIPLINAASLTSRRAVQKTRKSFSSVLFPFGSIESKILCCATFLNIYLLEVLSSGRTTLYISKFFWCFE